MKSKLIATLFTSLFLITACSGGSDTDTSQKLKVGGDSSSTCVMSSTPHYGSITLPSNSGSLLPYKFADSSNQDFQITLNESEYGYFIYPAILGEATFIDRSINISGGWDGATWPTDGSIGSTYGPAVTVIEGVNWFVYRTDFATADSRTWGVYFTNENIPSETSVNCDLSEFTKLEPSDLNLNLDDAVVFVEPEPEPEPEPIPEGMCRVSDVPHYGSVVASNTELALDYKLANTNNQDFDLIIDTDEYGYFTYPAALGEATLSGGAWDGATWTPYAFDPNITTTGPTVITRDGTDWLVYRTDFPGSGRLLISLAFTNAGLNIGDTAPCDTSSLTRVESTDLSFNFDNATLYTPPTPEVPTDNVETCTMSAMPVYGKVKYTSTPWEVNPSTLSSSGGQDFNLSLSMNEYGFFAYPASLGKANFFDRNLNNTLGAWDGATWTPYNPDFEELSQTGPIVTEIDGTKWFVYRTDFYNLGDLSYAVRFDNPNMEIGDTTDCDVSDFTFDAAYSVITTDAEATPEPEPEPEPDMCTLSALPRFGTNTTNIWTEDEVEALSATLPSTSNQEFTIDLSNSSDFGFFSYPVVLGEATFVDTSINIPGGWDGAAWGDDWMTLSRYTPIIVQVDSTEWFVYRTDFSGIGIREFKVSFENTEAALNSTSLCNTEAFPKVSTGTVTGAEYLKIVYLYATGTLSSPLASGSVSDGTFKINVTALANSNYDIYFATEASGGLLYGPQNITVVNGELVGTSFDTTSWSISSN